MELEHRTEDNRYYVYIYLDPRKPGRFIYEDLEFEYQPFYVGKGNGRRYRDHLQPSSIKEGTNGHKTSVLKKIIDSKFDPLEYVIFYNKDLSEEEALSLEISIISKIGCAFLKSGPLTNQTIGGESGSHYSKGLTLEIIHGEEKAAEIRKKLSEKTKGEKNGMFGKVSAMKGKKQSPEIIKKQKEANYKPVYQFDKQGKMISLYGSVVEASEKTGIRATKIAVSANPNSENKTGAGFAWIYKEDFERNGEEWLRNFDKLWIKKDHSGNSKRVQQLDKDTLTPIKEWSSAAEAARTLFPHLRYGGGGISQAIAHEGLCGGFKWKFVDKEEKKD